VAAALSVVASTNGGMLKEGVAGAGGNVYGTRLDDIS
jgi:hypothetical protein